MATATVELRADSSQIKTATDDLKKLETQGRRTEGATNNLSKNTQNAGKAMGVMGRRAGQAGIQIQQLVGQVQAGTSPFVALSQQAADLGIVLGAPLIGAVAGIGAALVGSLVPSLMDSSDEVEELVEQLRKLEEQQGLTANQANLLSQEDKDRLETIREDIASKEEQIQREQELIRLRSTAGTADDPSDYAIPRTAEQNQRRYARAISESQQEIVELRASVDTLRQEEESLTRSLADRTEAEGQSTQQMQRMAQAGLQLAQELELLRTEQEQGEVAAAQLALAYELGLESLEELPESLRLHVQALVEEKQAMKEAAEAAREKEAADRKLAQQSEQAAAAARRKAEATRAEFAALQGTLGIEMADDPAIAQLEEQLAQRLALIDEYRMTKQADQAAADQAELDAFAALERQKTQLAKQEAQQRQQTQQQNIAAVGDFFGSMAQLAYQGGAEQFEAYKAFATAQALISTYQGATAAYASLAPIPYVGPALGAAAAAAAIGLGLQQVAAIRAQQPPGRAVGGQVMSGGSYLVGERGPELFTPSAAGGNITPFSQLMSEVRQGSQAQASTQNLNVSFAISANDTKGFDELLVKRRDLVYNMIRKALNDQGRRF